MKKKEATVKKYRDETRQKYTVLARQKKAENIFYLWYLPSVCKVQHCLSFLIDFFLAFFNQLMNCAVMLFATAERVELGSIFPCPKSRQGNRFWFLVLKKALQVSLTQLGGIQLENLLQLLLLLLRVHPPEHQLEVADFRLAAGTASGEQGEESCGNNHTPA